MTPPLPPKLPPTWLLCLLALLGPSGPGRAAAPATLQSVILPATLGRPLGAAQVAGLEQVLGGATGVRLGLLVTDAASGQTLYARQPDALFVPASNMKLLSLGAALFTLGPGYWFSTSVTRPAGQAARVAHLTLAGSGDPSLDGGALAELARRVYASGVRSAGGLRLDARLIGAAPGQGQAGWRLPVVERPVSGLTLADPSAGDGAELTTRPDARAALMALGRRFRAELERAGVKVGPGLVVVTGSPSEQAGAAPEEGVATTRSAPLSDLVTRALKRSDNVWAEQLYARLGVDTLTPVWRPASLARARGRETALLSAAGAEARGLVLADGSGLSERNRLSPRALARLLRFFYLHPLAAGDLSPQAAFVQGQNLFVEALPRAGTGIASPQARLRGGTLAGRLAGLDVRAKTGTLPGASALSGYLRTASGRVLVFSVLMDGYPGPGQDLRRLQDALLRVLAADT